MCDLASTSFSISGTYAAAAAERTRQRRPVRTRSSRLQHVQQALGQKAAQERGSRKAGCGAAAPHLRLLQVRHLHVQAKTYAFSPNISGNGKQGSKQRRYTPWWLSYKLLRLRLIEAHACHGQASERSPQLCPSKHEESQGAVLEGDDP